MKLLIWISITVFGTIGGWIGAALTHNNWFSLTSIVLGGVGSLLGIYIGFKVGKAYF